MGMGESTFEFGLEGGVEAAAVFGGVEAGDLAEGAGEEFGGDGGRGGNGVGLGARGAFHGGWGGGVRHDGDDGSGGSRGGHGAGGWRGGRRGGFGRVRRGGWSGGLVSGRAGEDIRIVPGDLLGDLPGEFAAGLEGAAEAKGGADPAEVGQILGAGLDHRLEQGHFEEGGEGGEEAVGLIGLVWIEVIRELAEGFEGGAGAMVAGVEAGEGGFAGGEAEAAFGPGKGGAGDDLGIGRFLTPAEELGAFGRGELAEGVVLMGGPGGKEAGRGVGRGGRGAAGIGLGAGSRFRAGGRGRGGMGFGERGGGGVSDRGIHTGLEVVHLRASVTEGVCQILSYPKDCEEKFLRRFLAWFLNFEGEEGHHRGTEGEEEENRGWRGFRG